MDVRHGTSFTFTPKKNHAATQLGTGGGNSSIKCEKCLPCKKKENSWREKGMVEKKESSAFDVLQGKMWKMWVEPCSKWHGIEVQCSLSLLLVKKVEYWFLPFTISWAAVVSYPESQEYSPESASWSLEMTSSTTAPSCLNWCLLLDCRTFWSFLHSTDAPGLVSSHRNTTVSPASPSSWFRGVLNRMGCAVKWRGGVQEEDNEKPAVPSFIRNPDLLKSYPLLSGVP